VLIRCPDAVFPPGCAGLLFCLTGPCRRCWLRPARRCLAGWATLLSATHPTARRAAAVVAASVAVTSVRTLVDTTTVSDVLGRCAAVLAMGGAGSWCASPWLAHFRPCECCFWLVVTQCGWR
jgi:hypothetical protein